MQASNRGVAFDVVARDNGKAKIQDKASPAGCVPVLSLDAALRGSDVLAKNQCTEGAPDDQLSFRIEDSDTNGSVKPTLFVFGASENSEGNNERVKSKVIFVFGNSTGSTEAAGSVDNVKAKIQSRPCPFSDFRLRYQVTSRVDVPYAAPAPVIEFSAPTLSLDLLVPPAATSPDDSGKHVHRECPCPSSEENDEFEWVTVIPWTQYLAEKEREKRRRTSRSCRRVTGPARRSSPSRSCGSCIPWRRRR